MNWFKKKFEQFSEKLNADDTSFGAIEKKEEGRVPQTPKVPERSASSGRVDNIEELKEITLGAISNTVRMLGYSNTVISGLVFHSVYKDNAIENVGLMSLMKDPRFLSRIKRELKSRGVAYKDDLRMEVLHESPDTGKVTAITEGIGVEVLTPKDVLKKQKARVVATEGVTWEPEYILEPTGKHYFIGRGKDPKIESGPKIHNDIAFVGIEEKNEEQYKVNNFISRSHAVIVFDKEIGAYKLFRSKFLNNPSHKIKIFNASLDDFSGISLSNATVPHILKNGDSICFNDRIVLEFGLLD
ncbi:FHA domain-containing protein [Niabella drilacis]|uniref:FHA domain-containing protein n=1 Tax=Niabella drilacis (strain DSM 25811 / CCM 8410 / CCUG 62505 / LMG 26954 / E90) TaxID=1285928 RepID=A0A1G6Y7W1_NIADE|nr:FHA domain-containing protein [Niabella drilacis]SDD86519.1 hypothetical protein SAMN04487894_11517 [Niabella drilacis]